MPSNNNMEEYSENITNSEFSAVENSNVAERGESPVESEEQLSPEAWADADEESAETSEELQTETTVQPETAVTEKDKKTEGLVCDSASEEETTTLTETRPSFPLLLQKYRIPLIVVCLLILAALCAAIAVVLKKKNGNSTPSVSPLQFPSQQPDPGEPSMTQMPAANTYGDTIMTAPAGRYTTESPYTDDGKMNILSMQNIGNRPNQEDSFGYSDITNPELTEKKGVLGVVADGMGGLAGGEEVSALLVEDMVREFNEQQGANSSGAELDRLLKHAVQEVNAFLTRTVGLKKSGSTLMAVICKNKQLSWVSVGDSRIVLYRKGRLTTLNQRHVYGAELDEMVRLGKISAEEALTNTHRGELTSYVGMGELKYVDRSVRPLTLQAGDKVMLMSDGVFNALSDEEISSILQLPSSVIEQTLEEAVLAKQKKYQDNFTALIIEI